LHVHWPEFLVRGRNTIIRAGRTLLFSVLLIRLKLQRIPVVRTVHNLAPHSPGGKVESWLLRRFDKLTTLRILINRATSLDAGQRSVTILHGHYIEQFADMPQPEAAQDRFLYFGRIEPYKGVDRLAAAFLEIDNEHATLHIVGKPTAELAEFIEDAAQRDPRISSTLSFVDDATMVSEICEAELVVLPYREMHNSGVLLVALSLGRPALVPRSPANELLSEEAGPGWVIQFDGELTADTLSSAIESARATTRSERPNLGGRDWHTVAAAHYDAYLTAIAAKRPTGSTNVRSYA